MLDLLLFRAPSARLFGSEMAGGGGVSTLDTFKAACNSVYMCGAEM